MTLLEFLENARFPTPPVQTFLSANTTDISLVDIGLVDEAWRAQHAFKDPHLVDHLRQTLRQILGQTPLPENNGYLARYFSLELERNIVWQVPNTSEAQVRRHPQTCTPG
jgi:hypothetical protein